LEDSDDLLVQRVGKGDREAFRRLVDRHLRAIVAFSDRALADHARAEDVAQEVFLRLWSHAPRWEAGGARLTTWLHRVALNLCLDHRARRRETPLDGIAEPPDPQPLPLGMLQRRDIGRHVSAALDQLPEQQRIAITLCHYQGLRNREAAEVMGVSIEAVESLLARGRRTLRARLGGVVADLLEET
jgi:RNA polymerase sigma-70 factor (ECF subfamily)